MNVVSLLASFEDRRVLVIGDSIVDIETHLERIKDDDTGKPTYRAILDERGKADRYSLGGAGLVVRNLLELGAKVDWITATGYGQGALFVETYSHPNLKKHAVKVAKPQTVKHRFKCNGEKVLQVDTVDNEECKQLGYFEWSPLVAFSDVVVVADYRHGLINEDWAAVIVLVCNENGKPLYVASQVAQSGSNHHWYGGEDTRFVLNENEMQSCVINPTKRIMTRGEFGCAFFDGTSWSSPTVAFREAVPVSEVVDTCGAGDAFLAATALGEWGRAESLEFANTWAGLSCTVQGANPPTKQMLLDGYSRKPNHAEFLRYGGRPYVETVFCG